MSAKASHARYLLVDNDIHPSRIGFALGLSVTLDSARAKQPSGLFVRARTARGGTDDPSTNLAGYEKGRPKTALGLVELRASRNRAVKLQQIQALFAIFFVDGGKQHAARIDTHHLARR